MSFVVPVSPVMPNFNTGFTPGVSAGQFASGIAGTIAGRYGTTILGAAATRIQSEADKMAERVADSIRGDNTSTPVSGRSKSNSNGDKSKNGNPTPKPNRRPRRPPGIGGSPNVIGVPQLSLNTGIESGTINNPLQRTTSEYTPLFVQCGQLLPSGTEQTGSAYQSLLNNELFYKYLSVISDTVNYSLIKAFTAKQFYDYIDTISIALQIYYMVDSILAFTSHTPNHNIGMTRLRMGITPEMSSGHIKLRELLQSTPIPPNMLTYIRHMYQNYSFSDVFGAPIIRLSFGNALCTKEFSGNIGLSDDVYRSIINKIIDCSVTSSTIAKIRPNWKVALPPSSYEALYDPQFSTFWHNSDITYREQTTKIVKHTISADNDSDMLYYGIFGNNLDGIIYASCSVSKSTDQGSTVVQKGLWSPFTLYDGVAEQDTSLLYVSKDDYISPVHDAQYRFSSMVYSAPHIETGLENTLVWKTCRNSYAGACIPQLHTLNNVEQAVARSVNWLFAM